MSKTRRGLLVIFLLLSATAARAQEGEPPQPEHQIDKAMGACIDKDPTTAGTSDCIYKAAAAWDRELNKNYNKLLATLGPKEKPALKAAQLAWIKFRESEYVLIDALYDQKEGTMYISMRAEDRLRVVKKRAQELAAYLDLIENQ